MGADYDDDSNRRKIACFDVLKLAGREGGRKVAMKKRKVGTIIRGDVVEV